VRVGSVRGVSGPGGGMRVVVNLAVVVRGFEGDILRSGFGVRIYVQSLVSYGNFVDLRLRK
jgi:hypothetical protein